MANSYPQDFIESIKQQIGDETDNFLDAIQDKPATAIRLNPAKPGNIKFPKTPVTWAKDGFYLEERPSFTHDPLFHAGAYYVQDASSMFLDFALRKLELKNEDPLVLDLCGAPGGKSTNLLSWMDSTGLLIANEVINSRRNVLNENLAKWGYPNYISTSLDPTRFAPLSGAFDLVVVDAPCSGEGLFRKDANAINEWSVENVKLCTGRQNRILNEAIPLVREGGYLIYSTCTFERSENEAQVDMLLENGFESVALNMADLENSGITTTLSDKGGPCYRFYPHKVKGEGFFLAVLKKAAPAPAIKLSLPKKRQKQSDADSNAIKKIISPYFDSSIPLFFHLNKERVTALPREVAPVGLALAEKLNIWHPGFEVGTLKNNTFIPAHSLALSFLKNDYPGTMELGKDEALKYLSKQPLTDIEPPGRGWLLVKYKGLNLGWIKAVPGRINNYYPSQWRIRNINR